MRTLPVHYPIAAILAALALMLAGVVPATAQEPGDEIVVTGVVISIDAEAGSLVVETEEGVAYTVFPGVDFDLSTLLAGDTITVTGTLNEDTSIAAVEILVIEDPADDEDPADEEEPVDEEETPSGGYYCTQSEVPHPFGAQLAERYGVPYETLQAWFCDGLGWGQIMLALQTGQVTGEDPAAIIEARVGGAGWGQIWKELKLIGRPEDAGPPNDEDNDGKPDPKKSPEDKDDKGKPDHPGKPDNDADDDEESEDDNNPGLGRPPKEKKEKPGKGRPHFSGTPEE